MQPVKTPTKGPIGGKESRGKEQGISAPQTPQRRPGTDATALGNAAFSLQDPQGELVNTIPTVVDTMQRALNVLLAQDVSLAALDKLSSEILTEFGESPSDSSETNSTSDPEKSSTVINKPNDTTTKPTAPTSTLDASTVLRLPTQPDAAVQLMMDEYKRVCDQNAQLVAMLKGAQQMNVDLAFYSQRLLSQLGQLPGSSSASIDLPESIQSLAVSLSQGGSAAVNKSKEATDSKSGDSSFGDGSKHLPFIPSAFHPLLSVPATYDRECEVCMEILRMLQIPLASSSSPTSSSTATTRGTGQGEDKATGLPVAASSSNTGSIMDDDAAGILLSKLVSSSPSSSSSSSSSGSVLESSIEQHAKAWAAAENARVSRAEAHARALNAELAHHKPIPQDASSSSSSSSPSSLAGLERGEGNGWARTSLILSLVACAGDFALRKLSERYQTYES